MPAVTQLIPNFLGGVSKQNDDKKLEGQVTECINGYPDPTYGLLKRPGMKFIDKLKDSGGNAFNKTALDDAVWHFIDRGAGRSYIAAFKGTNVYAWETDGTWCTVTNTGTSYLTGTGSDHYHFRSIQDTTIVTNKTVTTAMGATGSYTPNSVATLKLLSLVVDDEITVTIEGQSVTVTAQNTTTFDDMLFFTATPSSEIQPTHHLIDGIRQLILDEQAVPNTDFDGKWYLEGYNNSIVIRRTNEANGVVTDYSTPGGTPQAFEIDARGGAGNLAIEVFEDDVTDVSKLPLESFHGHVVKILNSSSAADDYFLKFVASNPTANHSRGYWQETTGRYPDPSNPTNGITVATSLDASTMPHALISSVDEVTGVTTFTFGPLTWVDRLTGDDVTNPQPSFIGKKINASFFYNNRLGFLSEDNIIFGVANDSYNFFAKSATTQIDSDPIDVNVSSVRPVTLTDVVPAPQGLVVFASKQQFLVLATESGVLTPASTLVRSVSTYESATNISPLEVGNSIAFVNKVTGYSKLFYMQLREVGQSPSVVDISKTVLEWIPDTVDDLIVSPQNSMVVLVDRQSSYIYIFRFYNNGESDVMQAWTKWQVTGTIQSADILDDEMIIVTQHHDEYTINTIKLDEVPTGSVTATVDGTTGNACLDMATRPKHPTGATAVVYDSNTDKTVIYTPFTPITGKQARALVGDPNDEAGYSFKLTPKVDGSNYHYFEADKDVTGLADGIIIGYDYDFEVTLPKFYFRRNPQTTDFTGNLTISRVKVSAGRSGILTFKTKLNQSKEWTVAREVIPSGVYKAGSEPVEQEQQFVVPIHQRNMNFEFKITSSEPYPVSLVSLMWEGNYTPKNYRRV